MRRDENGQLQLLESVMVALFIFIAIALVAVYRLPSTPETFVKSELENIANDVLKVRQATSPRAEDDCNEDDPEAVCTYSNDLERLLGLAVGARGYYRDTNGADGELPDAAPLKTFLDDKLPAGAGYRIGYGNGITHRILTPLDLEPPAAATVVARTLVTPNWTKFAPGLSNTTVLRIGEATGLGFAAPAPNNITDALNRDQNEATPAVTWKDAFLSTVPTNAMYGTYRLCPAAACAKPFYNFTIVPPAGNGTVYGAGSQILPGDALALANLKNISWAADRNLDDMLYRYDDPLVGPTRNDALYVSLNATTNVKRGDLRLTRVELCRTVGATTVPCAAGTYVRTGDLDEVGLGRVIAKATTTYQAAVFVDDPAGFPSTLAPYLYLLKPASGSDVKAGDVRLSRVGIYQPGSFVVAGQADVNRDLSATSFALNRFYVKYADANNDDTWDEGEPVVLDYNEGTGDLGAQADEFYFAQVGYPGVRYPYDVKLEVWYGV